MLLLFHDGPTNTTPRLCFVEEICSLKACILTSCQTCHWSQMGNLAQTAAFALQYAVVRVLLTKTAAQHAYLFCCTIEALQVIVVALVFRHDMNDYIAKVQHFPAPTANSKHM